MVTLREVPDGLVLANLPVSALTARLAAAHAVAAPAITAVGRVAANAEIFPASGREDKARSTVRVDFCRASGGRRWR